jgi:hypothetical protein
LLVREHLTGKQAVVTESNRVVAEVTKPALAELDADRRVRLLVTGDAGRLLRTARLADIRPSAVTGNV